MAKAVVTADEFKGLPQPLQKEYAPTEGDPNKYQLNVDEVDGLALANVTDLMSSLEKERSNAKNAEKALGGFKGIDAKRAREALKFVEDFEKGEITGEAAAKLAAKEKQLLEKYEGQRKQLEETVGTERNSWKEREALLVTNLQGAMITSDVRAAIATHDGIPEILEPMLSTRVKLVEENGKFIRQVIGDNGQPLLSRKSGAATQLMDLDEYVGILKAKPTLAGAFKGSRSSGGGGGGGDGGKGGGGGKQFTISAADAKDVSKYRAADAAATKAGQVLQIVD